MINIDLSKLSSPDIEIQLLQNIFLDPINFASIEDILKPEYFYNYKRQVIYESMQDLYNAFEEVTYNTVIANLMTKGKLGTNGDQLTPFDISTCGGEPDKHLPNFGQNLYLAKIIAENYIKREFIINCNKGIEAIITNKDDFSNVINSNIENSSSLLNISEGNRNRHIKEYAESFIIDNQENGSSVFSTGYEKLDKSLSIRPGHLVIIGAGTSHGKTVFALNLARNFAKNKKKVGFFSLEMPGEELTNRIISNEMSINAGIFRHKLNSEQKINYNTGKGIIKDYDFYINDKAGLNIARIKSHAVSMVKNLGVQAIFIDYLQLIKATGSNMYQSTTEISQSLKVLAKDLKVPIIALSQFSRSFVKENRKPKTSDLRDSGAIEQDADSIMLLYNYAKVGITEDAEGSVENIINIDIAKDRHGECYEESLYFNGKYQRITNDEELDEDLTFGTNNDFDNNDPF
jgi:replicative DNA helicase